MKIPGPVLQVVARLGQLCERVVFVGGQVAPMLITDPGAAPPRATKDVDLIIDVDSHSALERLAQQLRSLGFTEAMGENVICRWLLDELIVGASSGSATRGIQMARGPL